MSVGCVAMRRPPVPGSPALPIALIVLMLRQDMAHVKLAPVEVDDDDQPVLVPADVEHRELAHLVGTRVGPADIRELLPFGVLGLPKPGAEWLLGIGMRGPERAE